MDGELLAEYAANAAPSTPQKEYGYRNGELLMTASNATRLNVALSANGAIATASSYYDDGTIVGAPFSTNDGEHQGINWGHNGGWNDAVPSYTFPDWLQIAFNGTKNIDEIDVYTLQDNYQNPSEPTETMTFSQYGLTGYEVQYWNGSTWVDVPNGNVTGNNKVWRQFSFSPISTSKIRVLTNASIDGYSRLTEVEAYQVGGSSTNIEWLVNDQLGTPRMVVDQTGTRAGVKRHDYLPFGEELCAGTGGRTPAQGYGNYDGVRQRYTSKERDDETGLDYFINRYYSSTTGRFTSVDPLSGDPKRPQSWNRYAYVLNNPFRFIDPDGLRWAQRFAENGDTEYHWFATEEEYWNAVDQNREGWQGWAMVTFDESQPYVYQARSRNADELTEGYVLNPDGTNGYTDAGCSHCGGVTTDWNAQLAIGSGIRGLFGLANYGIEAGAAALATRTAGGEFVSGLYGKVSVKALESAAASEGPTVEVVTRLTQAPAAGRALSVATGDGAETLANAARGGGELFRARVPAALIDQLKRSGLAIESTTRMGQGAAAATATELRILPQASRFVTPFFK